MLLSVHRAEPHVPYTCVGLRDSSIYFLTTCGTKIKPEEM